MYKLGARSKQRLKGVHEDLVKVVERAIEITTVDFTVLEGLRDPMRQKKLKDAGASMTLNSRHITGHAVDLGAWVDGEVRWDWGLYLKIAQAMKNASEELDIPIRWGGTWDLLYKLESPITAEMLHKRFPDGPHFELPVSKYP
jgi:peptidoglycan L-alanyl-D-glutamate endopeptidase CwlK